MNQKLYCIWFFLWIQCKYDKVYVGLRRIPADQPCNVFFKNLIYCHALVWWFHKCLRPEDLIQLLISDVVRLNSLNKWRFAEQQLYYNMKNWTNDK